MHTASYEFLMKPKELARYHQTLPSWVGSGDETSFWQESPRSRSSTEWGHSGL